MKKLIIILIAFSFIGCTENARSKSFGGSMTINVKPGNKVTNITWKKSQLWYSFRPFTKGEEPTTTSFVEESSFGVWEGTVTFKESN